MRGRYLTDQETSNSSLWSFERLGGGGDEMRIIETDAAMPAIRVAKAT
jgi:hypothetical protein